MVAPRSVVAVLAAYRLCRSAGTDMENDRFPAALSEMLAEVRP